MNAKQQAAEAAMAYVKSGMIVGLGTGSTADYFLSALGAAVTSGALRGIRGIPSSLNSEKRAIELGIPLTSFVEVDACDVYIDGADEVAPSLDVIKGLGGALLREKIVAQNSRQIIIIADGSKRVAKLGTKGPVPVEVAQFSHDVTARYLGSLGCVPTLRLAGEGRAFITDNGNFIYDCKFHGIDDPADLDRRLKSRAGVVETGLFVGMAHVALIADEQNVRTITRK